jgi:hypothetical protein
MANMAVLIKVTKTRRAQAAHAEQGHGVNPNFVEYGASAPGARETLAVLSRIYHLEGTEKHP